MGAVNAVEPLPDLARPAPALEEEIVESGVEIQQEALQLRLPLLLFGIGIELAQRRLIFEKPATLMATGGRLYLWVTFRPSWGGVPCRIGLKVNGFQGKIAWGRLIYCPTRYIGALFV